VYGKKSILEYTVYMSGVEFDQEADTLMARVPQNNSREPEVPGMVKAIVKTKVVKNPNHAYLLLLAIILACIISAIFILGRVVKRLDQKPIVPFPQSVPKAPPVQQ
jgi:hypothetical protein